MKPPTGVLLGVALAVSLMSNGRSQSTIPPPDQAPASQGQATSPKPERSAGGDVGSGAGDIGKGAAKGAGNIAAGTGKGAVDLVTLHPIDAAGAVGTGAAKGGKNIIVGTAKGTGKIVKGTGRAIKHIF